MGSHRADSLRPSVELNSRESRRQASNRRVQLVGGVAFFDDPLGPCLKRGTNGRRLHVRGEDRRIWVWNFLLDVPNHLLGVCASQIPIEHDPNGFPSLVGHGNAGSIQRETDNIALGKRLDDRRKVVDDDDSGRWHRIAYM
jgi:hypothetical protein